METDDLLKLLKESKVPHNPLSYKIAKELRERVVKALKVARSCYYCGYNPARAKRLQEMLQYLDGLNIYEMASSSDIGRRISAGRAYEHASQQVRACVQRYLAGGCNDYMEKKWILAATAARI